jgi:hypothetical protein
MGITYCTLQNLVRRVWAMPTRVHPDPVLKAIDLALAEHLKLPTDRVYETVSQP